MTLLRAKRLAGVLLTLAMAGAFAAPAQPKRVLILHSFSSGYFVNGLRTELNRQLPGRVDFYEHWLVSARSTPLLLTDVEERRLTTFSLAANETVVASTID